MSKPTAGKPYTVVSGDTVERIASIAYGDASRANEIVRANQFKSISAGDVIIIPGDVDEYESYEDGLSLVIAGVSVKTESMRISRSLDSIAGGWSAVISWSPGSDLSLDAVIRPWSFAPASVFVNGELVISGRIYRTITSLSNRQQATLYGWSRSVDLVDSTLAPPYESNDITLFQRVKDVAGVFNLNVVSMLDVDGVFDRVTVKPNELAGRHLLSLASQRGVLISSNEKSDIVLFKIEDDAPVDAIKEGDKRFSGFSGDFDSRRRFNAYRVVSQSPGKSSNAYVSIDSSIPVTRATTITAGDVYDGETKQAAEWARSKAIADSIEIPIIATGFTNYDGKIWHPGQLVTLQSPTIFINEPYTMVIKSVEMTQSSGGDKTRLALVPPFVYRGSAIEEPWSII